MEDEKSFWNSKPEIFRILQPFWTSGHRRSNCIVQRKGHFLTIHTQGTQTLWDQNLQTLWWDWIHLWYDSLCGQRQTELHTTWMQLMRQYQNWRRKYKVMATNCIWTITSPPQTYSMTWPRSKFTVVALSDPTGRACHWTWAQRESHFNRTTFKYGLGVTWQQCCGGTNTIYVFWQTCTLHQQRVICVIIMGRL